MKLKKLIGLSIILVATVFNGRCAESARPSNMLEGRWVLVEKMENTGIELDHVAVASAQNVWALDARNKNLYHLENDEWAVKGDKGKWIWIAAGSDNTIAVINIDRQIHINRGADGKLLPDGQFIKMEGAPKLTRVSVASKDSMMGFCDQEGSNPVWSYENGIWKRPVSEDGKEAEGFADIAKTPTATIAADEDGNVYVDNHKGVPEQQVKAAIQEKPKAEPKIPTKKPAAVKHAAVKPVAKKLKKPVSVSGNKATPSAMNRLVAVLQTSGGKLLSPAGQQTFQASLKQLYSELPHTSPEEKEAFIQFLKIAQDNSALSPASQQLVKQYLKGLE